MWRRCPIHRAVTLDGFVDANVGSERGEGSQLIPPSCGRVPSPDGRQASTRRRSCAAAPRGHGKLDQCCKLRPTPVGRERSSLAASARHCIHSSCPRASHPPRNATGIWARSVTHIRITKFECGCRRQHTRGGTRGQWRDPHCCVRHEWSDRGMPKDQTMW